MVMTESIIIILNFSTGWNNNNFWVYNQKTMWSNNLLVKILIYNSLISLDKMNILFQHYYIIIQYFQYFPIKEIFEIKSNFLLRKFKYILKCKIWFFHEISVNLETSNFEFSGHSQRTDHGKFVIFLLYYKGVKLANLTLSTSFHIKKLFILW